MKTKRLLMAGVSLIIACAALYAGGAKETVGTVPTIVIATADNTYGLSTDPSLQAELTKAIEERTGVKISPIVPPLASYTDKLSTLINSGDVPDAFAVSQAMSRIPVMVAREQIVDLTDYIADSPVLSTLDPSLFDDLRIDGRVYHVPYNYPKSKAIFVRKDIMERYGINLSSTPTTEEFLTEMSKLVGTGIIPFMFPKWVDNFQYFYNSFGAWGGVYRDGTGKFIDGFQEPQMREALTYLNRLYKAGVINQEFITTENSAMREKTYTAQAGASIDYVTNYVNYVQNTTAADKYTEMHLIYEIIGPRGEGGSLNEAVQTGWAISSKSKNPAAAFRVIETIVMDPEIYPAFYGIGLEGHHYTLDGNGAIVATAKAANSGYKYTLNYLSDSFIDIDLENLPFTLSPEMQKGLPLQIAHIREGQGHLGPNHSADVPVGASLTYDRVSASIKSTRESIAAKIIIGSSTLDEGMREYENFWKSIDGPRILADLNGTK